MPFRPFGGSKNIVTDALIWNGKKIATDAFIYFHPEPGNYSPKKLSDFTVIKIDSFFTDNILENYQSLKNNLLLWSDQPQPDKENYFPPKINCHPVDWSIMSCWFGFNAAGFHFAFRRE